LGIFGLNPSTRERDIKDELARYGEVENVDLVIDRQTGRSRCFAFAYMATIEDAIKAKDGCAGLSLDGRPLRIDFSFTQKPHDPTPGRYLGRPTHRRMPPPFGPRFSPYQRYPFDPYFRMRSPPRYEKYDRRDGYYDDRYRGYSDSLSRGGYDRGGPYERYDPRAPYDARPPYEGYGRPFR